MTHAQGVGDLMKHLGPEIFSEGIFHSLFVGFRPLLVGPCAAVMGLFADHSCGVTQLASSILNRQKTFLANKEWTTTPFCGHTVSIMQQLLNRASALPSLLQRYREVENVLATSNPVLIERLARNFRDILGSLQQWELTALLDAKSPLVWTITETADPPSAATKRHWFADILTANSLTHYWAFKIIIKTHLLPLDETIAALRHKESPAVSKSITDDSVADLAEMIINSMSYLLQPNMPLHHAGSSFFTLPTAIAEFQGEPDRYSQQLLRCQQIVDELSSRGIHFIRMVR